MTYASHKWLVAAALLLSCAGCAPNKPSETRPHGQRSEGNDAPSNASSIATEPVALVDGETITLGEFNRRLSALPDFARARYATVEQKQSYLTSVAQFEMMADQAEKKGLGDRAPILYAMKQALADRLVDAVGRKKVSMDDIDQAAIARYYREHAHAYHQPARRRVALIEVDSREQAAKMRRRVLAEMDGSKLGPVNAFRGAAATYSIDRKVGGKGGDIGFVDQPGAETKRPAIALGGVRVGRSRPGHPRLRPRRALGVGYLFRGTQGQGGVVGKGVERHTQKDLRAAPRQGRARRARPASGEGQDRQERHDPGPGHQAGARAGAPAQRRALTRPAGVRGERIGPGPQRGPGQG